MSATFYALIELMGHGRLVGYCSWQPGGMLRVEPITEDGETRLPTRHYGPGALFCVYPCEQHVARLTASLGSITDAVLLPRWVVTEPPKPSPTLPMCSLRTHPIYGFTRIGPIASPDGVDLLADGAIACAECVDTALAKLLPPGTEHRAGCQCLTCDLPF